MINDEAPLRHRGATAECHFSMPRPRRSRAYFVIVDIVPTFAIMKNAEGA